MMRVLISGYIGFDNFGDEAIFKVLKEHLYSLKYTVSALSAHENYNVKTYNRKSFIEIFKALWNCDVLISGGGSLLQNKTSNFSLLYYLSIIVLAKLLTKRVIIFAQGFEPIKHSFFRFLTRKVLKMCDFVSVRDEKSQRLLSDMKIYAHLLSDPVYSLLENIKPNKNKKGVLIQLRDVKGLKKDFIPLLAEIVSKNADNIAVLPLQKKYDEAICAEFIKELQKFGKSAKIINHKTVSKTINEINNYEFVISTRLHGLITSSALNCKTFALSYDDKIKSLCEESGIENIDLFNYNPDELKEKLEKFFKSATAKYKHRKFEWYLIDDELLKSPSFFSILTSLPFKMALHAIKKKAEMELLSFFTTTLFYIIRAFYTCKNINYPKEKCVFALWHAHQCGVFSCNQGRQTVIMVSSSNDGEIISRAANAMGVATVRGSQTRGGTKASMEMIKKIKEENMNGALTIDGPKGPNRIVKKGIIEIAKLANVPIVPAIWWSPQKRFLKFKSWDKFRFPLFGTKLVMLYGEPIDVPEDATKEEAEAIRKKVEDSLKELYADMKKNYHKYWSEN